MRVTITHLGKFGEEKATYARAVVVDKPEVVCPAYWECGGCQLMYLSDAEPVCLTRR